MKKTVMALLLLSTIGNTQSGGNFTVEKSTIASGGGHSEGGNFTLSASIGQHDANTESTGGDFALNGGFWVAKTPIIVIENIFVDGFEN